MLPTRPEPNKVASSPRVAGIRVAASAVLMSVMSSSWSVRLRQVAQRGNAGQEEVGASPGPDELRQAAVTMTNRARWDRKGAARWAVVSGDRVRVVIESVKSGTVQPRVLDEFELPGQVGRQADEVQPGTAVVSGLIRAVAASTAQQTVQVTGVEGRGRPGSKRVTRIGPADVRADRACQAERVAAVGEVVIVAQGRDVVLWRLDQRGAAGPAADHLGREGGPVGGVWRSVSPSGCLVHEPPEAIDILFELTEHQVGAVAPEVDRAFACRIG